MAILGVDDFKAKIDGDSIKGKFWYGNHYVEDWAGVKNDAFELPNQDSLTY